MKRKNFLLISLSFLFLSGTAFAGTASVDNVFVANDVYSSDFPTRLNRNFTQLENQGINNIEGSTNIKDDSLLEKNMADEINPRVRTKEGASCADFVPSGLLPQTSSGTLTSNITAGTGYPLGYRINKASNTAHTWTASKWTWTDVDTNGDFHYTETAFGAAAPAVYANSMRLARVSSDTVEVNNVLDMRITSCTTGPFNIIADATGESNLNDLLAYGNGGYSLGLGIASKDANSVYVNPGSMYINGQYRTLTSQLAVPINSAGSSTAGTSGLDSGVVAAATTYYLYAAADQDALKPLTGIFSTSPTTPNGVTNYRKIGEVTTDAGKGFTVASADRTTINWSGKIRQIKKYSTGAVATGTTVMVNDDTPPTSSEGDQYMQVSITPTSASNRLRVDVVVYGAGTPLTNFAALFQDGGATAVATSKMGGSAGDGNIMVFSYDGLAGTTSATTFKVRAGVASGTFTFNGAGGARLFGGTYASSVTVYEYEP